MNFTLREIRRAAEGRGIRCLDPAGLPSEDFLILERDGLRVMVQKTRTPFLSAVALKVSVDKALSSALLAAAGLPVPEGRTVLDLGPEARDFLAARAPLAVKPVRGDRGLGVTLDVATPEELQAAFRRARAHGPVLLERQVPGRSYRVLVIDGEAVAAYEKRPPVVRGDGSRTVAELLEELNRGRGPEGRLLPVVADAELAECLARQGLSLDSRPAGEVALRTYASLSTGGEARDVTDRAHASHLRVAVEAARVLDVDVAGVDLVAPDLARPGGAVVLEVNSMPGVRGHLYPAVGESRPVLDRFLSYLFRRAAAGRGPALCPGVEVVRVP